MKSKGSSEGRFSLAELYDEDVEYGKKYRRRHCPDLAKFQRQYPPSNSRLPLFPNSNKGATICSSRTRRP